MPAVQADAISVLIEAKYQQYERDFDRIVKKTQDSIDKIKSLTQSPIEISGSTSGISKIIQARNRQASAERSAAQATEAAVRASISARNKEATASIAAANRIRKARELAGTSLGSGNAAAASATSYNAIARALRQSIGLQKELNEANAAGTDALQTQITILRTINRLRRAGVTDARALERIEQRILEIRRRQASAGRDRRPNPPIPPAPPPQPPGPGPGPGPNPNDRESPTGGAFTGIRRAAGAFLAGYGAVHAAQEYAELIDAYKAYNAQLRLAVAENGNLWAAQKDVSRIAAETRTGLSETASLYAVLQRNSTQLGISQGQVARATEIISKTYRISGASAEEAAGSLRQFIQGLQSGTLRGEEFNSVVENAPRLAKLLADQLTEGNIGALRELAQEGKITGNELVAALTDRKVTASIDAEFRQIPVTFGEAAILIKNSAIEVFGAFDEGGEFSKMLVNFATGGSRSFGDLASAAEENGAYIRSIFAGLGEALSGTFDPLLSSGQYVFQQLGLEAKSFSESIADLMGRYDQLANIRVDLANTGRQYSIPTLLGFDTGKPQARSNVRGEYLAGFNADNQNRANQRLERQLSARFPGGAGFVGAFARGEVDSFGNRTSSARPSAPSAPGGGRRGGAGSRRGPSAETLERRRIRNEDQYQSEVASLNTAILSAKGKQAQSIEEVYQAALTNADAELKEREQKYQNLENEKKIDDAKRKVLVGLAGQIAAQEKLTAATERAAALATQDARIAQDDRERAIDAKRSELDITQSRDRRAQLQKEILDAEYENRRLVLERNIEEAKRTKDLVAQRKAEGDLAALPGQRANDDERNRLESRTSYERYRDNLKDADTLNDDLDQLKVDTLEGITDELTNATTAALGLKGAFGQIVGELIRIGIQRKLIGPLADGLFGKSDGSTSGGLGSLLGSIGTLFGGGRASGGAVTAGVLYRVNEAGTEGFRPSQSGEIIPLGRMRQANSATTVIKPQINVDARGAVMNDKFAEMILKKAEATSRAYSAEAGKQAYNNSPKRLQQQQILGT